MVRCTVSCDTHLGLEGKMHDALKNLRHKTPLAAERARRRRRRVRRQRPLVRPPQDRSCPATLLRRAACVRDLRRLAIDEVARGRLAARIQPRTVAQLARARAPDPLRGAACRRRSRGSAPSLRGGKQGTCAFDGTNPTLIVLDQRSGAGQVGHTRSCALNAEGSASNAPIRAFEAAETTESGTKICSSSKMTYRVA